MVKILNGDVMDMLRTIPDGYFNTCVTSPPYFGLRDYGTASWEGGDANCDHKIPSGEHDLKRGTVDSVSSHTIRFNRTHCHKCGAERKDQQIGLEETPEDYVQKLVEVFREVRRTLRDDGTLWLNLGDTYATGTKADRQQSPNAGVGANRPEAQNSVARIGTPKGLKTKDLIGIPWRVAFALQADGWYLRQDIIWHKPNPMPESVQDRCTKAHEYIFLLSKSPKYYFDYEAIKEPAVSADPKHVNYRKNGKSDSRTNKRKNVGGRPGFGDGMFYQPELKNKRSVWTVTTKPYKGAHFATFPQDLIEPCILAGAPDGGMVLDPFGGSGTTGLVSSNHGRKAVLIELNPEYVELAKDRLGLFYTGELLDGTP